MHKSKLDIPKRLYNYGPDFEYTTIVVSINNVLLEKMVEYKTESKTKTDVVNEVLAHGLAVMSMEKLSTANQHLLTKFKKILAPKKVKKEGRKKKAKKAKATVKNEKN